MIGGAKNSMHTLGLARPGILIDQVIHEFGRWCHVGFPPDGHTARNERLTIANTATGYELGLRNV